jgi:raffinose/stachyose/melibiose transport system substrate-binding protein
MMVLVSTSLVFSGGEQEIDKGNMEGRTLDILYFVGGMGQMPDPVIEKLQEKYPGLEVKIEYNQRAEDIIRNRMMANDAPDIFCINANRYSYYGAISEGLLGSVEYILNTETENNSTIRDLFLPGVLQELGYVEGTNYLLPQALYYGGFWYDDTLLKKYNVEPPETWDDFLIACEKFKDEGIYGLGYLGQAAQEYLVNYFYMPMLRTIDPEVYTRVMNLDPNSWETQAARELFERIVYIRDMATR